MIEVEISEEEGGRGWAFPDFRFTSPQLSFRTFVCQHRNFRKTFVQKFFSFAKLSQNFLRSAGITHVGFRSSTMFSTTRPQLSSKFLPSPAPRNFLNNFRESLGKPKFRQLSQIES